MKNSILLISLLFLTSCEDITGYTHVKDSELKLYSEMRKTFLPLLQNDSMQIQLPTDTIYLSQPIKSKVDSFYKVLKINKIDKFKYYDKLTTRRFVVFTDGSICVDLSFSKNSFGDSYEHFLFYPANENSIKQFDDGYAEIDSTNLNFGWKYIAITYRNL